MKNITTYPQPSFARPFAGALPMLLCLLGMLMGSTSARADQINVQYQRAQKTITDNSALFSSINLKLKQGKWKFSTKKPEKKPYSAEKALLIFLLFLSALALITTPALYNVIALGMPEMATSFTTKWVILWLLGIIGAYLGLRHINKLQKQHQSTTKR
ncbi:MAG: hypothetical protein IT269_12335 [Saprospiraceae bacterium]|nr:hypothetical protein [Saprospiraceae bacterium]